MTVVEDTPTKTPQAQAEKQTDSLFKYSDWVHIGQGAEECENKLTGTCQEAEHFHAWIRLPNPFQVKDIGEKARAALARRKRMLRDPESDAYSILELELEDIRATDDKEGLVDEIVDRDFQDDYVDAVREIEDVDSEEPMPEDAEENWKPPKLYANVMQDREERDRMLALPDDQRDEEELASLQAHLLAYEEAVRDSLERRQAAKKAAFMDREWDDLLKIVRQDRVEQQGQEVYIQTFNMWQWFVCTYKTKVGKGMAAARVWGDINQMRLEAPPEVIEAVRMTFRGLEQALSRSRIEAGN